MATFLFFFLLRVNQIPEKNSTFLCNSGRRKTWGCHPTARRNTGTTVIRSIAVSRSVSDILRWFQGYRVLWVVRRVCQSSRDLAEVREAHRRYSYCRMRKFWYIHRRLAFSLDLICFWNCIDVTEGLYSDGMFVGKRNGGEMLPRLQESHQYWYFFGVHSADEREMRLYAWNQVYGELKGDESPRGSHGCVPYDISGSIFWFHFW